MSSTPTARRTSSIPTVTSSPGSYFSSLRSPRRHHQRTVSSSRIIKETRNARTEYSNSEDDGASQHRINQYLLQQEIGRGSFGAVHLATDQYGKEFAIKEFSKSRLRRRAKSNLMRRSRQQTGQDNRFGSGGLSTKHRSLPPGEEDNSFDLIKEEIAIMKKLDHINLVNLIEVLDDPEEDSLYMVLEMCKKGVVMQVDLEDDADPYDEESCRCWFRDLILGIEYLHAQGVVHRDIKPDNCLLTENDTLKVVDFGVSEMFSKDSDMKVAKSAGSPAFMAPELCTMSQGGVYGKPADIWSMGVTLYCLRFGRVPFRKTAVLELYQSIIDDEVEIPANAGEDFTDLITRLLEKTPEKRIKMEQIREHPWVTLQGEDPLLPAADNCAHLVALPTEEEKNAAITGNVGSIVAVLKAVHRFKTLIARNRPKIVDDFLGRASQIVHPPETFSKAQEEARSFFKWPSGEKPQKRKPVRDAEGSSTDLESDHKAEEHPHKDQDQDYGQTHPHHQSTGKGQAHNPLEDHLFLNIGMGGDEEDEIAHPFEVSESPPAVDVDVYSNAYQEEVGRIHGTRGHDAVVYLTRRIEEARRGNDSKHHQGRLAELLRRTAKSGHSSADTKDRE